VGFSALSHGTWILPFVAVDKPFWQMERLDLKPVAVKMTPADFEAEVKRCGPMVVGVVQGLQAAQGSFGGPPPAATAPATKAAPPAKK
jgi:hypothetical protein